jgi:TonB family protein
MTGKKPVRVVGSLLPALALFVLSGLGQEPKYAPGTQYYVLEWEMRLRVLEGLKEGTPAAPAAVTSSFLKYTFSANFRSEEDLAEEQNQIRRIFNLKDARLLTEGLLDWRLGKPNAVDYVFRLDGKEYRVRLTGGELNAKPGAIASQTFRVEVIEEIRTTLRDQVAPSVPVEAIHSVGLLDTEFTVSSLKNVTVFGFEDSQGKPYFISLRQTKMYADEAVVKRSGVKIGQVVSEIRSPKLIKLVDPVYPPEAIKAGISGVVNVEVTTDLYGQVATAKVLKSVPGLDQAAIDAVKQWVYEPMTINGRPRAMILTGTLQFLLATDKDGKVRGETHVVGGIDEEGRATGWLDSGMFVGVQGGVEGGVKGGVEGGVVGGIVGGVVGGVIASPPMQGVSHAAAKEKEEFEKGAVVAKAKGAVKPPLRIKVVDPVYPEKARQAQVEGVVILEARTDERGNVEDVMVLRSVPALDQAAIDAVKQWKYEPMLVNGKPQKVVFDVTVRFMLKPGDKEQALDKFAQGAVKAEGTIEPPMLIKSVDPVYPPEARKAGVEGVVILSAKTDATGHVQDVMILRSVPLLNQAAIDAVRQWVYEPYLQNGKPTPIVFTVTVIFKIK